MIIKKSQKVFYQLFLFLIIIVFTWIFIVCTKAEKPGELTEPYFGLEPPGKHPEIFAPGIISKGFHEIGLVISPNGDEMFYRTSSKDYTFSTILTVKKVDNIWSKPEIAPFSGLYREGPCCFSPDGKKLYISSNRPLLYVDKKSDMDIWYVEKIGDCWNSPVNLGKPVNTKKDEAGVWVASSGNMYFQAKYYEKEGWDLYFSKFKNGKYYKPVNLGKPVNTSFTDAGPYVAPDESYLLFQSDRPGGYGGNDLYVSFREKDGSWGKPVNLGEKVNSSANDFKPRVSPDGKYLFFSSYRGFDSSDFKGKTYDELMDMFIDPRNGYATIYWVDAGWIEYFKKKYFQL